MFIQSIGSLILLFMQGKAQLNSMAYDVNMPVICLSDFFNNVCTHRMV
jgi:hypothetical protein